MVRRWVCGVVVVALVFSSLGWSAPVMAKEKEPSDYYGYEFSGGVLGGIFGASIGNLQCGQPSEFPECAFVRAGIGIGSCVGVVLGGYGGNVKGNVVGACVGSFIGLAGGLGLYHDCKGFLMGRGLASETLGEFLMSLFSAIVLFPACAGVAYSILYGFPSALAVYGYNIGAKMKDTGQPASLPWALDLPVLSLEF